MQSPHGVFVTAMAFSFQSLASLENHPKGIVCLSDETAEVLYHLRAQDRIVGGSGFSKRPAKVRSKPRVSAFCNADFEAIIALKRDLVLTFSDVQADITRSNDPSRCPELG